MKTHQGIISCEVLDEIKDNNNVRIIDVRFYLTDEDQGRREFIQSHIPDAVYLHLNDDLSGEILPGKTGRHPLPSKLRFVKTLEQLGIDQTTQIVIYDQGPGGIASRLWWLMQWLGHDQTTVLNGGWNAWIQSGGKVDSEIIHPSKRFFKLKRSKVKIVDRFEVHKMINDDSKCIVDSRLEERYRGEFEPIDPIAGHIPSAINFPFPENIDANGNWKSKDELRERFSSLFKKCIADQIAVYCGSGVTACHNLLAMHHAGYEIPKLYSGSWSDWITSEDAEISITKV